MKFFLITLLLSICAAVQAQKPGSILGHIYTDEDKPLDKATITLLNPLDSTVQSYLITDDKGKFHFSRIPSNTAFDLLVSHVGYAVYSKRLQVNPEQTLHLGIIKLVKQQVLDEVVVTHTAPVRHIQDTIEYTADYFKTRPNASVEELLRLLPGLQVNIDGSIYYQGKEVQGIRVNNKDFFASDMRLATKNLDANLVAAVQVFRDKAESKQVILDDSDLPIILNLKLKKEFVKAQFGKFYASAGNRDRYEAGALLNTFRDTLQISFIGYANNLNRKGFDYSELSDHGGFGRAEYNNQFYSSSVGLKNALSAAININYDIQKKLKTNFLYMFEQEKNYNKGQGEGEEIYAENSIKNNNSYWSNNKQNSHQLRAFGRYHLDSTAHVAIDLNFRHNAKQSIYQGLAQSMQNAQTPVRDSRNANSDEHKSPTYRQQIGMEKRFTHNKWTLSLNHELSNNNSSGYTHDKVYNRLYLLGDSLIDQNLQRQAQNLNLQINNNLKLQIPYKKLFTNNSYLQYNYSQTNRTEDLAVMLNDSVYRNKNDIANDKKLQAYFLQFGNRFTIQLMKGLSASVGAEWLRLHRAYSYYTKIAEITKTQQYWLPNASINYKNLILNYNQSIALPSFTSIIAVNSTLYPASITYASPYFDNERQNKFSARYSKYFQKIKLNYFFNFEYTQKDKSIGYIRSYDLETSESSNQNYQAAGLDNFWSSMNFRQDILKNKQWNIYAQINLYAGKYPQYSIINGVENLAKSTFGNWQNTLSISWQKKLSITPSFEYGFNKTVNTVQNHNFKNIHTPTKTFGSSILLSDILKFRLEGSYKIRNQAGGLDNERINLHLINASLYYPFLKKGEVKFTAFDLLNQNKEMYRSAWGNSTYYSEYLTLRQYFMVGLLYKFLNSGS